MSSEEDFSLVLEPQSVDSLTEINALISNYKKKFEQLQEEHKELAASRDDRRELSEQFRQRRDKITQMIKDDERLHKDQLAKEKAKLGLLKEEQSDLMLEIESMEAILKEEEARNNFLKQQADVFSAVPERKLVFKGSTADADDLQTFEMKPHVVYPMDGGTALITFEEEVVAKNILDKKQHRVDVGGDCSITVAAHSVHLMLPRLVEMDTEVCPRRILISDLPKMDPEALLDKLEIHFSKTKNGGGEVEDCEMMPDSGTVVLTFVEKDIAKGLVEAEHHTVKLLSRQSVRVTPFLNGTITNLQTKMTACPRTVLLTGIPDIMEPDTLQDLLEIHFQKNGNGGGEIEAFLYNPLGQHASALFGGVAPEEEK